MYGYPVEGRVKSGEDKLKYLHPAYGRENIPSQGMS